MIVEIEGCQIKMLVSGKKCSISKLCWQMKKATSHMENHQAFISVFCRLFNYEEVSYTDEIQTDFVIDIDTYKVFKGSYEK